MKYELSRSLRNLLLTIHILLSVGWVGSVAVYLSIAIVGMTSQDEFMVRSSYLMMEVAAMYVIVPLSIGSFLSGITMALGTRWGLFRHYWVVFSFGLTILAIVVLFLQIEPITQSATLARDPSVPSDELRGAAGQVLHAGMGLLLLLVITGLNVFKPRGLTPYGQRKTLQRTTK